MSKINTKTSVHLMQMNDRGMQKFGVKELLKNYDENIIDMIEKATTAPFNSLPEVMEALEAYKAVYPEVDQIMQGIQEVVKKKKANEAESDYKLPIEEIMDLYHSGDDFLMKKAKECIINNYSNFVKKIIFKCHPTFKANADDLYQCGVEGLLQAMKGYDVSQGAFTTYSQPFIRHMINSQINFYTGSTVHYTKIQSLINDAIKMLQDKGMEPTVRKITTLTDLKPEIVRRELDCIANTTLQYIDSADTKDEEYGSMTSPEDVVIEQTKTAALQKALFMLDEKSRDVIIRKFVYRETISQISKDLCLTPCMVKTACQKGLHKLRMDPDLCRTFPEYLSAEEKEYYSYNDNIGSNADAEDILDEFESLLKLQEYFD